LSQKSAFVCVPSLCLVLAAIAVADDKPLPPLNLSTAHKGTIEIDTALLNQAPQPDTVQDFFATARQTFETHPMGNFADLPAIREAAEKNGLALLGGPMLGSLSPDGARVWVRTVKPAQVTVTVQTGGRQRSFGPVASTAESDLSAVVPVTGLEPETRYPYRVLVDGQPVPLPAGTAITTAPEPGAATRMTIAFGADFHKTGLWNRALLDRIRTRENAALLLLGDNAADDRDNRVGLHRSDYLLRDLSPAWRELTAAVPVYATWDDHDYFNNDRSGIPAKFTEQDRDAVRKVWTQSWNNPAYGLADRDLGIFFHTRLGPCDLIMLDTRSRRTVRGQEDCYLGAEQMRWLEQELAACTGPFVILTSGTMWSDYVSAGKDSWGVWDPPGRERLLSLIEEKRIGGVILLSGDRHGARVMRIERPSGFTFWEFELGSLGAHPGPPAMGKEPDLQPFGVIGQTLFGECTFDTTVADPTATIRIVDPEGNAHYQVTLTRSQMTPGNR
jgi:alkaline phosphatase D